MRLDLIVGNHLNRSPRSKEVIEVLDSGIVRVTPIADEEGGDPCDSSDGWVVITDPSFQVFVGAELVSIGSVTLKPPFCRTLALNKPLGVECGKTSTSSSSSSSSSPTQDASQDIYDVLKMNAELNHPKMGIIGRLDKDTSGLILTSTDGGLQICLMHPASHLDKGYEVQLHSSRFETVHLPPSTAPSTELGIVDEQQQQHTIGDHPLDGDAIERFKEGLKLDDARGTVCKPATLQLTPNNPLSVIITISEGMHHQIKRMVGAVRGSVTGLHRLSVGPIELGDLGAGEARLVTPVEMRALARAVPFELRGMGARNEWVGDEGRPTERNQRKKGREKKKAKVDEEKEEETNE
jgi:16S rRNA pseudouridine516 synthase